MKIKGVNYTGGGMSLEIVAEGEIELMILKQIWGHGEFSRGNGSSLTSDGCSTGFYLQLEKSELSNTPRADKTEGRG